MQKRPLLLSSAKMGVMQEQPRRYTWRKVLLVLICAFFVIYGAIDIAIRIFSSEPSSAASLEDAPLDASDISAQAMVPSAASAAMQSAVAPFTPERLVIPALSINTNIQLVGKTADGNMANPKGFSEVGWYKLGSKPGEAGNTVIAGHLNNALGLSGVFEKLNTLQVGSDIVVRGEGRELHYTVTNIQTYDTDHAPASSIFSTSGPSGLVLITCDGAWNAGVKSYNKRLIVSARPA